MKRVIYIGNRSGCLNYFLERTEDFKLVEIFAIHNSPLFNQLIEKSDIKFTTINENKVSWDKIKGLLSSNSYDLLISNGCPFIIPITYLRKFNPTAIFLNTHPTYLPNLRGKTPLNGVLWSDLGFIGATTHLIDDGVDTGNIIYREKFELTKDIDQGLIYFMSFEFEKIVFRKAMDILRESDYQYAGFKPIEKGSYFNRNSEVFRIDFSRDTAELVSRKINSVGMTHLGNEFTLTNGQTYKGHNAEHIYNEFLLDYYADFAPGSLCLSYSDKVLIKVKDGLLKIAVV